MENITDRHIPTTIDEEKAVIDNIINAAAESKSKVKRKIISSVTDRQIDDLMKKGILVNGTWVHSIETSAVIHVLKRHGTGKSKPMSGQIPICKEDFLRIPSILKEYDSLTVSEVSTKSTGNTVIRYEKKFEDGIIYYLEEKRDGRRSLALQTMYKKI